MTKKLKEITISTMIVLGVYLMAYIVIGGVVNAAELKRMKIPLNMGHYPLQRIVMELGPIAQSIPGTASSGNYQIFVRPLLDNAGPMLQLIAAKAFVTSTGTLVNHINIPDASSRVLTLAWASNAKPTLSFPASVTVIVTVLGE